MGIGLLFSGRQLPLRDLVGLARLAESSGFESVWASEVRHDVFVTLAAIAQATERVGIGSYIANAHARTPWLTAIAALDLQDLSGGRFMLGLGTGNRTINEEWQGVRHEPAPTKLAEYLRVIDAIFAAPPGNQPKVSGVLHSLSGWMPDLVLSHRPPPVLLAAVEPRAVAFAARSGTGVALGACTTPEYLRDTLLPAHRSAGGTGRPVAVAAFLAMDADRGRAIEMAREAILRLFSPLPHPYYERHLVRQGFGAEVAEVRLALGCGDTAAARRALSDNLVNRVVLAGTPADCRARVAALDGLVDHLVLNVLRRPGADLDSYREAIQEFASR